MATRARHPFWLDGGYDRESVEACRYHPWHRWRTLRLGDVLMPEAHGRDPDERLTICMACYVPRCGSTGDDDRCVLPRHHPEEEHLPESEAPAAAREVAP
jgi:hypothetical protein